MNRINLRKILLLLVGVFSVGSMNSQCAANFTTSNTGNTVLFTSTSTSTTASTAYFWNFGSGNVQGGPSISQTFSVVGTVTVCLTIYSNTTAPGSCTNTICKTVTVGSSSITSISEDAKSTLQFNSYPNPCHEVLFINPQIGESELFNVVVYNILGEKLISYLNLKGASPIDVSKLSEGVYTLEVGDNLNKSVKKIIVNR